MNLLLTLFIILTIFYYASSFRKCNSRRKSFSLFNNNELNRLPPEIEAKTIMNKPDGFGSLSTLSRKNKVFHFPQSTIVGFSVDENGKPFFVLSILSMHTRNLLLNNSASLCVTEYGFQNVGDSRVTLTGKINKVKSVNKIDFFKKKYLLDHPYADWINYGDFSVYHMCSILDINYVGGFRRAGPINIPKYIHSLPDNMIFNMASNMKILEDNYLDSIKNYCKTSYPSIFSEEKLRTINLKNFDSQGINIKYIDNNNKVLLRLPFKKKIKNFNELIEKIDKDLF